MAEVPFPPSLLYYFLDLKGTIPVYSLVMAENLALLKANLSNIANVGTVIFGVVSCGLDIGSLPRQI